MNFLIPCLLLSYLLYPKSNGSFALEEFEYFVHFMIEKKLDGTGESLEHLKASYCDALRCDIYISENHWDDNRQVCCMHIVSFCSAHCFCLSLCCTLSVGQIENIERLAQTTKTMANVQRLRHHLQFSTASHMQRLRHTAHTHTHNRKLLDKINKVENYI